MAGFLVFVGWSMYNTMRGAIRVGDVVPDFTLQTFDGQTIRLADLHGKVVLVNFWASWCSTCKDEAESLEKGWQYYGQKGDVVFLGVAYVDTEKASLAYLDKYPAGYPNGPDLRSALSSIFGVTGVPETYLVGRTGRLEKIKIGPFTSLDELRSMVDPALQN
jgi:cytochrome c biogenesis protein CcmG/thiol:disulfide interchange protein DsbE